MKTAQTIIVWALFFLIQKEIVAQSTFNKAIDNPKYNNGIEFGYSIINFSDTNFIISSASGHFPNNEKGLLVIRINDSCILVNSKEIFELGKSYYTGISSSIVKAADGYVIAGSLNLSPTNSNPLIIKFDLNDEVVFINNKGDSIYDLFYNLTQTDNNNLAAVGVEGIANSVNTDIIVQKYSSQGDSLWRKSYGNNLIEEGYNIEEYDKEKVIVFGRKNYNQIYGAPWVLKIDSMGNVIQQRWFTNGALRCAGFGGQKALKPNTFIITGCLDTILILQMQKTQDL